MSAAPNSQNTRAPVKRKSIDSGDTDATPLLQLLPHTPLHTHTHTHTRIHIYIHIYSMYTAFWIKVLYSHFVICPPPSLFHTLFFPLSFFLLSLFPSLIPSSPSDSYSGDDSRYESQTDIQRFQPTYLSIFPLISLFLSPHLSFTISPSPSVPLILRLALPSLFKVSLCGRHWLSPLNIREKVKPKYGVGGVLTSLSSSAVSFCLQVHYSVCWL